MAAGQVAESLATILQLAARTEDASASLRSSLPTVRMLVGALIAACCVGAHDTLPQRDAPDFASVLARSFGTLASRTPAVRSSALSASALAPSGVAAFTDGAARTSGSLRGTVEGTLRSSTLLKSPPAETRGGVTAYVIFRRDLRAGGASLSASAIKSMWKKVSAKQKTIFKARAASEVKKKRVGDRAARAALAATTPATSAQGTAEASVQHSTFVGGATATVARDAAAATPNAVTALLGFGRALRPRA